ncbi:MAG: aspartate-semialdehyde dehydrogenase [Sedimenticola sp.]|nr:MAG: aspartate-semialdehyde dehydrogenase [Sedimenticola sp.]
MLDIAQLNAHLLDQSRASEFAGYDPFDSLNSRLLMATPFYRSKWVRLAWLQFGKRSPINFRPIMGVPKRRNPKGVGLFIGGLLEDYRRTQDGAYLDEARQLADWLLGERSDPEMWRHSCWGYHFDWQARAFYVPAGKPNIITTFYVSKALYDLGELTNDTALQAVALDSARFISKSLYIEKGERCFYAYIPGEDALVHNASLWGAAWCGFAGKLMNDTALIEQSMHVARQSVAAQAADGSWVYGARNHHQFIDGFHTGYNLEALHFLANAVGTDEFDYSITRGYQYYIENFFTEDGTAKYYNNTVYPIDMHNFAQAIFTLLKVGGRPEDIALCDKVVGRSIDLMYMPNKARFIYQKTRWMTNRISYVRWTQAWAYYALAFYIRYKEGLIDEAN